MNTFARNLISHSYLIALVACGQAELSDAHLSGGGHRTESTTPETEKSPANNGATGSGLTAGIWDDNQNFDHFVNYLEETKALSHLPNLSRQTQNRAHQHFEQRGSKRAIDIVLVIDTTGSMYDELDYLKAEFTKLEKTVRETLRNPDIPMRLGLIAYADHGEAYVVLNHGFPDSSDFEDLLQALPRSNGGDYPEAAAEGLAAAMNLNWSTGDDIARIVFWMADAPHHKEQNQLMTGAIEKAIREDIHIYPIAASGLDERTEKLMRVSAQVTGGRYIFLTDDSQIGNSHKEPRIPCYFVTTLQDAIERVVIAEITGEYSQPAEDEIIRTGGDPQNGRCKLSNGQELIVF